MVAIVYIKYITQIFKLKLQSESKIIYHKKRYDTRAISQENEGHEHNISNQ